MARITFDVTPEQHQQIKAMAALQGQSIRSLMLDKLELADEMEESEWEPLREILMTRIKRAKTHPGSGKTMLELFDEKVAEMQAAGLLDDGGFYIGDDK